MPTAPQAAPFRRGTPALQRLSAWVRAVPIRPAGLFLLAAAGGALWYGRGRIDLVVTIAALWGLALLAASGAAAALSLALARRDLRRAGAGGGARLEGVVGRPVATGLVLPVRVVPLAATPRLRWLSPVADVSPAPGAPQWSEQVTFPDRALAEAIVRELGAEDLLGLWRFAARMTQPRSVRALPDPGRLAAAELAASLACGDLLAWPTGPPRGDLVDFRTYTRSDPARLILWKVYARSRQLMVRAPEPARAPEGRPLLYLVAGEQDDAAAAAARVVLESGLFGDDLPFACDGAPVPVCELPRALDLLAASSAHRGRGGADLAAALALGAAEPGSPVLLAVPADAGAWLPRVLASVATDPSRFAIVAAADIGPDAERPALLERALLRGEPARPPFDALARGLAPLVTSGARLVLADRVSGRLAVLSGMEPQAAAGAAR
ncbi:MAG: DUF58 domain-containing protein [Acidobacteria bacterium]|jgi:hypothetical protein|nr:DUF58 domain-containing protein [Acidobacteriota bacterium]